MIHAIGAMVGMVYTVSQPVEPLGLLGNIAHVELTASWADPEDRAPPVEIAPTVPPAITPVESPPIDTNSVAPIQREERPIDVDMCRAETELAMAEDPMPLPALVVLRRAPVTLQEEPPQVVVSPPCLPRAQTVVPLREQLTSGSVGTAGDELPRKLQTNPAPPYPPDAFARRQQGTVLLEVQIDERGLVKDVSVWKSSGVSSLDRAASQTVRTWRFEPARRSGSPKSMVVIVPIRFKIQGLE